MKKIFNSLFLIALLCIGQNVMAEQWCSKTLTNGSNTVNVSCEVVTEGSLYRVTIEGSYLSGLGGSFCNIYDASGGASNVDLRDYMTVSDDKTTITLDFPSSQGPYFYTPLYVMMPGEISFTEIEHATITWGVCLYEAILPVMTSATLVAGSENHQGAQIAVAATDQTEEGGETTDVTNFKVYNGTTDLGLFSATNGVIIVDGLEANTSYTVTVFAYDDVKNLSATGIDVSFTTTVRVDAPTTAAPTPTEDAEDVASLYSDAYTTAFTNLNLNASWDQATQYSEVQIDGNNTILYSGLTYQGIEFDNLNISGYATMHMDFWVADNIDVRVYPITGDAEQYVSVSLAGGQWNSVDIDLSDYAGLNLANTYQFKIEDADWGYADLYIDNWYFYGEGTYEDSTTGGSSSDWCGKTLTSGDYTVEVSCELITEGELYRVTVVGSGIEGLGGAFATIYDASGTANNIDLRDYMTISADNTTLTLNLPSSADPIFYTPLYVMMPGEVSFAEMQFATITWGVCDGTTTNVENTTVSTSVVYPNPATDFMIVEAESTIEMITVYNIMGQTISSTVGGAQSATISVSGLSVGNYIVRVQTADGSVSMHKLIKQ